MIEPYSSIFDSFTDRFSKLGFFKSTDSDYAIAFSNGQESIEFKTEKFYQPSISTNLYDREGKKYALRLAREILSPRELAEDSDQLLEIKKRYRLEDATDDKNQWIDGLQAYISLHIDQVLKFLCLYKKDVFSNNIQFQAAYLAKENEVMKKIGL